MQTVAPEQVGLSPERLGRIAPVLQRYIEQHKVAGLIALIARDGQVAYCECLGEMDAEAHKPMTLDAIFRIYSMSKPITSVAVLMLYEEGCFHLNDPVANWIPAFKDIKVFASEADGKLQVVEPQRPVTIRDLLTHTSGIPYPNPQGTPVERCLAQSNADVEKMRPEENLAEWIPRLTQVPLAHQPGSAWLYGHSTDVLGHLVEAVSGMPFDAFLQQRIFDPLGMPDTGFYVPPEKHERLTVLYAATPEGKLEVFDAPATGRWAQPPRFLSGGGGMVSTTEDYLRFAQMLLNGGELDGVQLLGRKTVELMATNHLSDAVLAKGGPGPGYGFGLGVRVLRDVAELGSLGTLGEYGWAGWAGTYFLIDPQEELICLLMPQFAPIHGVPFRAAEDFRVLAYQAIVD